MTKWEYRVDKAFASMSSEPQQVLLDKLGNDGWDLVFVAERREALTYFFKRPSEDK